jgi:hypothetical protein
VKRTIPIIVLALAVIRLHALDQGQTVFRATADAIQVPVSVREGNRAIGGLTATDFSVTDNEVPQQVQALTIESVPLDVTLVVDTSESTQGVADRLTKDVQQVARLLRSEDTFRVVTVDTYVGTAKGSDAIPRQNGMSAVHDALIAALVKPVPPSRRHLIVAIIDLLDTISYSSADKVREVAARSDALLEIVTVRPPKGYVAPYSFARPRYNDEDTLILTEAAERTGGSLRGRGVFGDSEPVSAFKRALEEFRQSYVLRYSPRDVEPQGWHELAVTVPKLPNATVRARKGYYGS